jgi:hypothetical protein
MVVSDYKYQDRGPTSSSDYNDRSRDIIETYLALSGRVISAEAKLENLTTINSVELDSIISRVNANQASLSALENTKSIDHITGTASAGGASTVTDDTASWVINRFAGGTIELVHGTGSPESKTIISNTNTIITISGTWSVSPAAGTVYHITQAVPENYNITHLFDDTRHMTIGTSPVAAEPDSDSIQLSGDILDLLSDDGICILPNGGHSSKLRYQKNGRWYVDPAVTTTYNYETALSEVTITTESYAISGNDSEVFMIREPVITEGLRTLYYYVSIPSETAEGALTNYITVTPFPVFGCTLEEVSYTTTVGAALDETSTWTALYHYEPELESDTRFIAPGVTSGDSNTYTQQYCGPRRYYFGERRITGLRIKLTNSTARSGPGSNLEMIMGVRDLDVGHINFSSSGSLVFDIPLRSSASKITSITPRIINRGTSSDSVDGVGTTVPDLDVYVISSGSWTPYTLDTTVPSGEEFTAFRVYVKDMALASNGCTPILAGFITEYT